MNRREFLTGLSGLALVPLTGCLSENESGSERNLKEMKCPSFSDTADRTVCYKETLDKRSSLVYVEPSPRQYTRSSDVLKFTLHNNSQKQFKLNTTSWRIYKWADGNWVEAESNDKLVIKGEKLRPGGTYQWVENKAPLYDLNFSDTGIYAFTIDGKLGSDSTIVIEAIALFRVL